MLTRWLDARLYPSFKSNWDDVLFQEEVLSVLRAEYWLLDLGAGAGIVPQMNFRGRVTRVCGVDPDERVTVNPFLDEGRVGTGEAIPYPDRKSTRLNSSHGYISYAVFCLKKKKKRRSYVTLNSLQYISQPLDQLY